jgi:hypothetical protein
MKTEPERTAMYDANDALGPPQWMVDLTVRLIKWLEE